MHDHHPPPMPDADRRIVELRQYTLHPGRRDALIGLFDRVFIEPQEAVRMSVIGQFRDLDSALHAGAHVPTPAKEILR